MSIISAETLKEIGDGLNSITNTLGHNGDNLQTRLKLLRYAMSLGHLGATFNYGILQSSLGHHAVACKLHRKASSLGYGLSLQQLAVMYNDDHISGQQFYEICDEFAKNMFNTENISMNMFIFHKIIMMPACIDLDCKPYIDIISKYICDITNMICQKPLVGYSDVCNLLQKLVISHDACISQEFDNVDIQDDINKLELECMHLIYQPP